MSGPGQKRGFDGPGSGGMKRSRGDPNAVTLRFLVNSKNAGGIIGKGGATIKRLRNDFEAHVTVPDSNAQVRVLSIQASRENAVNVLVEVLPLYMEPPHSGQSGGGEKTEFEINFLMHSSQVGGVIGKGGGKIKELRESTNAQVKVFQECLPNSNERVIAVGGGQDEIVNCMNALLDVMQEAPVKGPVNLFDPSAEYDDFGFGGGMNAGGNQGRGGGRGGGRGRGMSGGRGMGGGMGGGRGGGMRGGGMGGGRGGGAGGGYQEFGGNQSYDNNQQWGGDYYSGGGGGANNFSNDQGYGNAGNMNSGNFGMGGGNTGGGMGGGNFGGPGPLMSGNQSNGQGGQQYNGNQDVTTTQVTIPKDKAGAIIGRGGERIRNIRQKSCCDIKIDDGASGTDRLITITGSQSQIQHAQYLMQESVRNFGNGGF